MIVREIPTPGGRLAAPGEEPLWEVILETDAGVALLEELRTEGLTDQGDWLQALRKARSRSERSDDGRG